MQYNFNGSQKWKFDPQKRHILLLLGARDYKVPRDIFTYAKKFLFSKRSDWAPLWEKSGKWKIIFAKKCVCTPLCRNPFFYFREKCVCTPFSQKTKNTQELKIMRLQTISQKISFLSIMLDFSENTFKNRLKKVKYIFFWYNVNYYWTHRETLFHQNQK